MKKLLSIFSCILVILALVSCKEKEKKPFGAADISYDKVEGINKNGPTRSDSVPENKAPFSDKVLVENGPVHNDDENKNTLPTADLDPFAKYDDVPIYVPEHKN